MYENNVPVCEAEGMVRQNTTLTELMGEANSLGKEALIMAKIIHKHFFFDGTDNAQNEVKTNCYYDVMIEHRTTLKELCETLHNMIEKLGCERR